MGTGRFIMVNRFLPTNAASGEIKNRNSSYNHDALYFCLIYFQFCNNLTVVNNIWCLF